MKIICKQCSKEFLVGPYRLKEGAKYCSRRCFADSRRGILRPEVGPAISLANTGRKLSEESKRKMSEVRKERISKGLIKINKDGLKLGWGWNTGRPNTWSGRPELKEKQRQKAIEIGASKNLKRYIQEHGAWNKGISSSIESRLKSSESHKKYFKENPNSHGMLGRKKELAPNWLGGKSLEKRKYSKIVFQLKEFIKKRDNYTCTLCQKNNLPGKKTIHTHHINYDKNLNVPQNLITLCKYCHIKTNFNRPQWIPFFQGILKEKYGYNYDVDGSIILQIYQSQIGALNLKSRLSSE